tara:strand:+ start:44 stop:343 length:300 start_codon:yes stop_codon:yes gene_type:complete
MVLPTENISYKAAFSDEPSFTRKELSDRFWTKTLIDKFLKEHDFVEFSNDIGWPRYLYGKNKVLKIESSFKFKKALKKSIRRRGICSDIQQKLLFNNRI